METPRGDVRVRSARAGSPGAAARGAGRARRSSGRGKRREAPRTRGARALRGLVTFVVGVGGPFLVVWLVLSSLGNFRFSEPPPPASLATEARESSAAVELVGSPDGRWEVADGTGSFVGYRVVEHYPTRTSTGVGRTTDIDAEMVIEDGVVTDVEVRADLRELSSDRTNRDKAARGRYLETDDHPTAAFELSEPLTLIEAAPGAPFTTRARGELTLHGITRPVTAVIESRWDGGAVQVVGTLPLHLPDHDIRVPDISGFVRVEEDAEVEFDLTFERLER
jgi:polyisoprenoid-binding protein YceI